MALFTYLFAALALVGWAIANWLIYVSDLPLWLGITTVGCLLLLAVSLPFALFRKQWLAVSVGLLTFLVILLPKLKVDEPVGWIQRTGFRAYASPLEQYLSNCKLLTISEGNRLQQIGQCASLLKWHRRIDIVYDTTGRALWPTAGMSPELKLAAAKLFSAKLLASPATRTHVFGNFYAFEYVDQEG